MKLRSFAFAVVPAAAAFSYTLPARADDAPARVYVHVRDAPPELVIEEWGAVWEIACKGECDRALDVDGTYRMSGAGIRASKPFQLAAENGNVVLDFQKRSSRGFSAGVALTVTGATFLATGLAVGIGSLFLAMNAGGFADGVIAAVGGLAAAGSTVIGLATLIPGLVLMANNPASKVTNDNDLIRPVVPFGDARATPPAPRFASIPIFSTSF